MKEFVLSLLVDAIYFTLKNFLDVSNQYRDLWGEKFTCTSGC
jgi:hypothetical protein